jgi:signal transduction histidine kinase/ligand-binding sensor domain-containing protein
VTRRAEIVRALAGLLFLAALPSRSSALDPSQPFGSYLQTHFTPAEDGLPSAIVDNIVQSHDGFLWLIVNGRFLVRFDGQHFTGFDEPANVRALAMAPNGDLWLGTADHLERIPAAALNQFGRFPGVSYHPGPGGSSDILCLHVSRDGALWVGTAAGLYRFADGSFSPIVPALAVSRIEEASNSHILAVTSAGFIEWDGSHTVEHPKIAAELDVKSDEVFHVLEDSHGVTWFCTRKGVARRIGNSVEKLGHYGPTGHGATRAYEDPQGNVWFFNEDGLYRATAGGLELAFTSKNPRWIYGDIDGDLWLGTNGDGLYRFKDRAVRMFTKSDGLPNDVIMTVLGTSDGGLWTGANCGGISRFDGKRFKTYSEKDGLLNSCVWSLAEDANRDLWIATWGGGAFRFRDGHFTQFSKGQGLTNDVVTGLIAARDGSVWLATHDGVARIRNGQVRNYLTADGLSSNLTITPFEDRAGGIWIATNQGYDRLDGDRFVSRVRLPDRGFPIGEDEFGDIYVNVEPDGEVRRINNGRLDRVGANLEAAGMVETPERELWLSGAGITRVASSAFRQRPAQDEPLDYGSFGVADGMASLQCTVGHPNSALTRDGKLWVATTQGLAVMDLPRLPRTARKPSIYVEEVTVGRNTQFPGHALVLPPGTHHVELQFDAIEISSPEKSRLQYRLDDVDSEWLDAPHPVRATYSNIPPGAHAFHIRACNRDGIWDRQGIVYRITQEPFFYETAAFRILTIAAGCILLASAYRFRLRQESARIKVGLEGRVAERERIARDLHDTLLQSFQGSLFEVQAARNLFPRRPDDAMRTLDEAIRSAQAAIAEGRDAIRDLRSGSAAPSGLAHLLAAAGQELSGVAVSNGGSPAFRVTVEGPPRDIKTALQDEVYRIGREILRNAFRHARAKKIEVEIRYDAQELRIRFRDDGIGIDPRVLNEGARAGHWGLPGVRERAKLAGAQLYFWSEVGAGTEVQVTAPASVAYAKSPEARIFGLFRKKSRSHGE